LKTKKAVIFGTALFAEVAKMYLEADSAYEVEAFTVHERYLGDRTHLLDVPVVPFEALETSHPASDYEIFVALGFSKVNKARAAVVDECRSRGYRLLTYVSSQAHHVGTYTIGENCFVFEGNVIQPFVSIGDNTILWSGNHIGHHSKIGNNCFIASHVVISGGCEIGDNSFIGVNATLRDGVRVAPESVIGAGALILKDTVPRGVYKAKGTEPQAYTSDELRNF
jgi:sugar O-acyltransferase (sialic acid O-acetyltransferase NeuD family)